LVAAPDLAALGPVSALRLSRDGTRVAVVAGKAGGRQLYVARVSELNRTVRVEGPQRVTGPEITDVVDASWASADKLAVLAGGYSKIVWTVPIDGSTPEQVRPDGLPQPPAAIAAAPHLPMLTVAELDIWSRAEAASSWTSVPRSGSARGSAPAYPG
jgi:Lipoprotein LpqB beta-propeller domain